MNYLIRPLEERDIGAIIRGEMQVFGTSLGFDLIYSDLMLNPYASYLVLEIDKKVAGYIGLWINPDTAEIINFYVLPKYQGMGFGGMLLEFAVDLCTRSNVFSMSLEVRLDNIKALNLYKKYGFIHSHIRENYYNDGSDASVMIRKFEVKK
jgi:ribosomal-protein-alanine N-acetyltransferase